MITAVVPIWNGEELLERLLISLEAQTEPVGELLVVDNGSEDGAPELARRHNARVIPMGRNAGFAAAVNRGIRESRGEWIAVLNSDVELAPNYFALLRRAGASFGTGKILSGAGDRRSPVIDGTFDAVCRGGTAWRVGNGRSDGAEFATARKITSPPWTAVLFRAEVFTRVGLLEESFESYLEDVDFGLRCAARQVSGLYVPDALAWHLGSATLGRWHPETVRRIARNQVLLLARHYSGGLLLRCAWPIAVAQLMWGAVAVAHGTGMAWLRGKWQGLRTFRAARRGTGNFDPKLLQFLQENEKTIQLIQKSAGFDRYWKWYFTLTGGGAR
ncbi:MAG TPA: glycosyltransferase family 2 protein [Bryobacteraceae bacterium]|nr:glycosyltransferase family 2 protein [Bryobacteraceae bacterium]